MDEELSLTIVKNKKINVLKNILKICAVVLFPVVLLLSIELLNGMDYIYCIGEKWINLLLISGLLAGIYSLTGKLKKSMIITAIITMGLAIINYILVDVRGTAITSADFYSIGMATKMIGAIKITLPLLIFVSIGLIVLWIVLCSKIKFRQIDRNKKRILRCISLICCVTIFMIFFMTDLFAVEITYDTKNFYKNNGVVASFLTILKEMKFDKPEGYSKEYIMEEVPRELEDNSIKLASKSKKKNPNIIVIMNESFADLSEIYNLKLSEDNMSFIRSMKENTIKANVYTSALGGKTANCEWEFLTGNSSKFLPIGAVPYQQYIRDEVPSIVDIMNNLEYNTSAFHPYNPEGYSRNVVYPLIGFKQYKFNDTMENLNLLRFDDFVDDLSTYNNIIDLFEKKKENETIFNFTVTMQNHTSYWDRNFKNTVFLNNYDKEQYFEVNQYLSLIKLSDEAFKYLVEYFEDFDEPTIIMMFGDHQPGFVENYPEFFGKGNEGKYDKRKYTVPMVLWANYDIPEYDIEDISMNYLSTILFDIAGLQKSQYMEYLQSMYEKYPVITVDTYKDKNGDFYEYEQGVPEDFKLYEYIQYNNMFDDEKLNYLFE